MSQTDSDERRIKSFWCSEAKFSPVAEQACLGEAWTRPVGEQGGWSTSAAALPGLDNTWNCEYVSRIMQDEIMSIPLPLL
jgi:hypothetical protein